ncbi:hypothetical protein LINGRAHAP2_LOCUS1680 [Linum grandiflorum]
MARLMNLATEEEQVGSVQDWPLIKYSDTKIESRRNIVWMYLVGEREPYTLSIALSRHITLPLYQFLHILFNGTINVHTDDNQELVSRTEIDLF